MLGNPHNGERFRASPLLLAFYYGASSFYSDNGSGVTRGRRSYFTPRGRSSRNPGMQASGWRQFSILLLLPMMLKHSQVYVQYIDGRQGRASVHAHQHAVRSVALSETGSLVDILMVTILDRNITLEIVVPRKRRALCLKPARKQHVPMDSCIFVRDGSSGQEFMHDLWHMQSLGTVV